MKHDNLSVYLLIDNGLLQAASASYAEHDSQSRPAWLAPVYKEQALEVSPILIDLEAAYKSGHLDQVMGYVNALAPPLHVSVIESGMSLANLTQHLRRFIFIVDPDGKHFTLRYADCAILRPLSSELSEAQWATMKGPIARWRAHDRSGRVLELPPAVGIADSPTPLSLNRDQLAALEEISEPDHCIAKVKMMRHEAALPGTCVEQHAWAEAARQAWRRAKNPSQLYLLFLTEAALLSRGQILHRREIADYLTMNNINLFRKTLQELTEKS